MKGLKIVKAKPSNAIDIYALLKHAAKEEVYPGVQPTEKELRTFYLNSLFQDHLQNPYHMYYLARRGRGYLGFLHAMVTQNYWTQQIDGLFIELIFVAEKHRKKGVAKKLLETLREEAENIGVKKIDLCAMDKRQDFWTKHGAGKITNTMRIEL